MNKRFLVAWLVVFIAWLIGSFLVHDVLLHADYASMTSLFRRDEEVKRLFPLMLLAHVIMSGAFVWIYARGVETRPWLGQGLRYGAAIALLTTVPMYLIYYVVQPMPASLVAKQIVFEGILILILGAIVAFMARVTAAKSG
jgi:hypothetical protein